MPINNWALAKINRLRRKTEEVSDYLYASYFYRRTVVDPYDGSPRVAMVVVNFNTMYYLKLLLLTLAGSLRPDCGLLKKIVIVDNGSREWQHKFLTVT